MKDNKKHQLNAAVLSMLVVPLLAGTEIAQADGNSFFSSIAKNAEYTFDSKVTVFNHKPGSNTAHDSDEHFQIRQRVKSQADINESWSMGMDLLLTHTSQSDDYAGVFRSPDSEERHGESLDFTTLYFNYVSDDYEVLIGKDTIETGVAMSNSPTNRFGMWDGINPMNPETYGVWQLALHYFINDDTLSFRMMPFHQRSMIPPKRSRWLGTSGDADFQSITLPAGLPRSNASTAEEHYHGSSMDNWGYLLEYKGSRGGYDFFALAHHGPSIYPVLKKEGSNYVKIDPQAWSFGGGVSRVIDEWTLYAEGIYQHTEGGKDDNFLRYSLGFSYRDTKFANRLGLQEIKPIVEISGDNTTNTQSANLYEVSSEEARPFDEALAVRVEVLASDKWSYGMGAILNTDEGDGAFLVGAQYRPNDNMKIHAGLSAFTGDDDTHFGRWDRNDNLDLGIEYKF